ncbi:hypothetical protein TSA66_15485 [Noviherbaspirillum autotrophicum]|uniref:Uncharacterized protein n=2 Tax=Noviherbaspirillum autotrophicum TaxID=709839 RepID=A0A0C2BPC4_9BURK|nr:hypothetical protein TSA66_15485 [Noviherbaspirillum autotrophicum]
MILTVVAITAMSSPHAGEAPVTSTDMDAEQWQTVERLLRYDAVMGKPLAPDIGFCVDSKVVGAQALLMPPADRAFASARFEAQVSQAAEGCISSASRDPGSTRFVGEIVASLMTARQRRIALETERARECLASSADVQTLKGCITKARGQALAESDWKRWVTLYEQARKQ